MINAKLKCLLDSALIWKRWKWLSDFQWSNGRRKGRMCRIRVDFLEPGLFWQPRDRDSLAKLDWLFYFGVEEGHFYLSLEFHLQDREWVLFKLRFSFSSSLIKFPNGYNYNFYLTWRALKLELFLHPWWQVHLHKFKEKTIEETKSIKLNNT